MNQKNIANISYGTILEILSKCTVRKGKVKICTKNIKELMTRYGYDQEDIDSISDDFLEGFGTAVDIITEMLHDEWQRNTKGDF